MLGIFNIILAVSNLGFILHTIKINPKNKESRLRLSIRIGILIIVIGLIRISL